MSRRQAVFSPREGSVTPALAEILAATGELDRILDGRGLT
jgi:hypothetical protein